MKIINLKDTHKYRFVTNDLENELFTSLDKMVDYLIDEDDVEEAIRKETYILMDYLRKLENERETYELEVFMEYEDGDTETFFITKLR